MNLKKNIFYMLIFMLLILVPSVALADVNVSNEEELISVLNDQSTDLVINLNNNITISDIKNIIGNVTINGNGYKITYNSVYTGTLFEVSTTGKLNLNNVTIDGNNEWNWVNESDKANPYKYVTTAGVISLPGKTITANAFNVNGSIELNNSTIQNFVTTATEEDYNTQTYNKVFVIYANGTDADRAVVVFNDVEAKNNIGVILRTNYSDIELKNNTVITNNYGFGRNGGIFNFQNNSIATMDDTNIYNNVSDARSGSIFGLSSNSELTMNSGSINNNLAKYWGNTSPGAMIVVESGAGFVMNGGSITNNTGILAGAIASRWTNGYNGFGDKGIELNNGTISNNTSYVDSWHNATIFARSNVTIDAGMIIDGNVVSNDTGNIINNGTIEGNFIVDNASGIGVNNGIVKGTLKLINGSLINNGTIDDAYENSLQLTNNGIIKNSYVKDLVNNDANKVVVNFNVNGGKELSYGYTSIDKIYDIGKTLDLLIDAPSVHKEGYNLDNWYMDESLTILYDNSPLIENVTLYAKWNANEYNVIFDVDGTKKTTKQKYNEKITLIENPTKEGYEFIGWKNYTSNMTVPINGITLIAEWKVNEYNVIFDVDGTKTTTKQKYNEKITLIENPTKEGYEFIGWKNYTSNMTVPINGITLTAEWKVNEYNVIFDVDGTKTTTKQKYNEKITLIENPVKEGYKFIGWKNYVDNMTMPNNDIVLIAQWEMVEIPKIPSTGDNIDKYIWMFMLSLSMFITTAIYGLKNKLQK
ncbi:MAG: InlB B-repeat-containing protein [Bacilli bacterium]|nr:InlB B-repeat-containing protein [Bacilli bacterium]